MFQGGEGRKRGGGGGGERGPYFPFPFFFLQDNSTEKQKREKGVRKEGERGLLLPPPPLHLIADNREKIRTDLHFFFYRIFEKIIIANRGKPFVFTFNNLILECSRNEGVNASLISGEGGKKQENFLSLSLVLQLGSAGATVAAAVSL